jgi:hypothetical protein
VSSSRHRDRAAIAHFLPRSPVHLNSFLHLTPSIRFPVPIPFFHAGKAMRPILGVPAGEAPLVTGLRLGRVGILKRHPAPISVAQFRIRSGVSLPCRDAETACATGGISRYNGLRRWRRLGESNTVPRGELRFIRPLLAIARPLAVFAGRFGLETAAATGAGIGRRQPHSQSPVDDLAL